MPEGPKLKAKRTCRGRSLEGKVLLKAGVATLVDVSHINEDPHHAATLTAGIGFGSTFWRQDLLHADLIDQVLAPNIG